MFYVRTERNSSGRLISAKLVTERMLEIMRGSNRRWPHEWENRNDWKTYEAAAEIAAALNVTAGKPLYQATDSGPYVSPRYDVIDVPQIGQDVSYTFNGDYYPCGKIKSISKGPAFRRIAAEDAAGKQYVFHRRCRDGKPTGGAWIMNGTWSMIQGIHNKLNPEF